MSITVSRRERIWHRVRGRSGDGSPRARPYLLGELVVVLILLRVYDLVKDIAAEHGGPAYGHALDVIRLERRLHVFIEPDLNRWFTAHHWLSLVASYYYQFEFYTVAFIVLGICWWSWPHYYRWARNALVLTNVVGLIVFVIYPVMPPRLVPHLHVVDSVAAAGFGSDHSAPVQPDQYAAMPSLHVAWALWVAIVVALAIRHRAFRFPAFVYPVLTTIAVMATANHYLLDAVAGAATTLLCAWISNRWGSGRGTWYGDRGAGAAAILAEPDAHPVTAADHEPARRP